MAPTIRAEIDGDMLVWARAVMRMSPEVAANKLGVTVDQLRSWEHGKKKPTVRQLRKIAKAYGQSFAAFYLPDPPAPFDPDIKDYRRAPGETLERLEPELMLDLRTSYERRESVLELLQEGGEPPKTFDLRTNKDANPEFVGPTLRTALGLTTEIQESWRSTAEAFSYWRTATEALGVLVFQSKRLPYPSVKAYSITADKLPAIVLNRKDRVEGRIFSLAHELAHLMLHASGVCDLSADPSLPPEKQDIEIFCNAVAGAAVVPRESLLRHPIVVQHGDDPFWSLDDLTNLSAYFGISREVVLRRLLTFGRTSVGFYSHYRDVGNGKAADSRQKKGRGPSPAVDAISLLGRPYVGTILDLQNRGVITTADAAAYLGLRLKHFPRLAELLGA